MLTSMFPVRIQKQVGNVTLSEHATADYLWWEVANGEDEPVQYFYYPKALQAFYKATA